MSPEGDSPKQTRQKETRERELDDSLMNEVKTMTLFQELHHTKR